MAMETTSSLASDKGFRLGRSSEGGGVDFRQCLRLHSSDSSDASLWPYPALVTPGKCDLRPDKYM